MISWNRVDVDGLMVMLLNSVCIFEVKNDWVKFWTWEFHLFKIYDFMNIYILNCLGLLNGSVSQDYSCMYIMVELKNTKKMLSKFYEDIKIKGWNGYSLLLYPGPLHWLVRLHTEISITLYNCPRWKGRYTLWTWEEWSCILSSKIKDDQLLELLIWSRSLWTVGDFGMVEASEW